MTKRTECITIDSKNLEKEYLKDLFRYRELFYFFARRDILVRYKETVLGVAWSLLRPLIYMTVFVLVFGKIARVNTDPIYYPLFVLSGMLPWSFFCNCLMDSNVCLISNIQLLSKVYFPRIVLPINCMIVSLVDFLISLALLIVVMFFMGTLYHWTIFLLPLFLLLTVFISLGASLWAAAITVRYRDFRFIVPFVIQFGMFLSPIGYSSSAVPEGWWRTIYFLNPMAGVIEGVRWSAFGIYQDYLPYVLASSIIIGTILLFTGYTYFRKLERVFGDII